MAFSIHAIYRQIFKVWRKRRLELFCRMVEPRSSDTILDVGGYPGSWTSEPQRVARVDTLNVHHVPWEASDHPGYRIRPLVGDGCALSMPNASYDVGFSNSVIEHVGSWEQQLKFASEIRRVANALWVQTPAYACPIEPHYLAPFIHYLPRSIQRRIVRWCTPWGWLERPSRNQVDHMVDSTRLLSKREMKLLFPDCEIITERMLGFIPKSYIAVRRRTENPSKLPR